MIEYEIPFVCLIFTTLISILFFKKKKVDLEENYYFRNVLIFTLLVNITNFVSHYGASIYLADTLDSWYTNVFAIINKFGSLFIAIITFNVMSYIFYISFEKYRKNFKFHKLINNIAYIVVGVLIFLLDFNVVKKGEITGGEGSAIILTFAIVFFNLIIAFLVSLTKIKKYDKRYNAIYIIIPLIFLLGIFILYHPEFNIYDLVLCLLCYLMYFTIENPDIKMLEEMTLAKEQAERANKAKSDFLSSMSHEIRTPINAIFGASQILLPSTNLTDDERDTVKDIANASETLLDIINNVLDMSKIETGNLEINNSNYDSKSLFESTADLVKYRIKEKGLEFRINIADDLPKVLYGDKSNFKKIITNLLSNATKYTDKGSIEYSVKCVKRNDICRLMILVSDTGRGIKKEDIEKLFTRFERLDRKNTTIEGTGLGLAITKTLLEKMNGRITVLSEFGVGSKFMVTLDQKIIDPTPISHGITNVSSESSNEVKKLDLTGKTILIVDDNLINLKIEAKLVSQNYPEANVITIESGIECIEKIKSNEKIDLILMDDMMPELSGQETFAKLKTMSGYNIPTIMLTANAVDGVKEEYLAQGFDDYLAKPVKLEDLNNSINKVFSKNIS